MHKVTIVPRGQALGVTYSMPVDDRLNYAEPYLRARIAVALGGRVAEELVFNVPSTGAENDFQQATHIARQMVTRWGMSPRVGPVSIGQPEGNEFLGGPLSLSREISEALAQVVDEEVRRIIDECYQYTRATLTRERSRLEALAEALLARESLEEHEIREVTGLAAPKPAEPAVEPLPAAS